MLLIDMKNKYILYSLLFLGSLTFHSFADHHDHYNFQEEHAAECQACEENVEIQISKSKTKIKPIKSSTFKLVNL